MKSYAAVSIVVLTILLPTLCLAADNASEKLTRGLINIVTAPVEIAKQIDEEWKIHSEQNSNPTVGIFTGFFKGVFLTIGRMGSGIWDVVSFPLKVPNDYEPLMKPEFVLDKALRAETSP